jgi:biopolymer transport protein TolR
MLVHNKRNTRRLMNEINVVPYIDVMLVLLVIFMVTAPLINPGQIELPQVGKTSNPPVQPMEVSIQKDGSLLLRDRSSRNPVDRPVSRNDLIKEIKAKQSRHADQAVVISADKDVRYEAVLEVMDMLQQNQVKKVGLLAKPRTP